MMVCTVTVTVERKAMQRGGGCLSSKDDGPCTSMRSDLSIAALSLRRQGIGLKNALFNAGIPSDGDDPFLINFVNTRLQEGRFNERFDGVTFLSRAAFRNEMPLPTSPSGVTGQPLFVAPVSTFKE